VLQGMRIPVRYAVMREEVFHDPFRNIKNAPRTHREKGVLFPAEVSRLIAAPMRDPRARLAVLLGCSAVCAAGRSGACNGET
jgi:hypothetical protein